MSDPINLREYGKLEQQVAYLSIQMNSMQTDMQAMRALLEQSKGGWRTLVWLAGVAGTIGAAATWISQHWSWK